MKLSKIIENLFLALCFLLVIAFPWVANYFGLENNLAGAEEKVELKFDTLDEYITQNFPGRELLVRTKNQLMYSLFDVSPNKSITKINNTLMSTETLNYYHHGLHWVDDAYVEEYMQKLEKLNQICKEKGKKLLVTTTPTKPRYYYGVLPFADDVILAYQQNYGKNPYEILRDKLLASDIPYFDCINYIDTHKDMIMEEPVPLFYDSGHHWSNYKGNLVGLGFVEALKEKLKIKLPTMTAHATPSDTAYYPDSDLFDVLNIYDKPDEQFYKSIIDYEDYENDDTNFTIQGGSFLGGLLCPYFTISINGEVIHLENKACLYNNYADNVQFNTYEELETKVNLLEHLKKTDVFILEVNELNVYNASFGFLEYLLSHEKDM